MESPSCILNIIFHISYSNYPPFSRSPLLLSISLSLSVSLSLYLSFCFSISLSVSFSLYLSLSLSVCVCVSLPFCLRRAMWSNFRYIKCKRYDNCLNSVNFTFLDSIVSRTDSIHNNWSSQFNSISCDYVN